jgi:hypothetical protein
MIALLCGDGTSKREGGEASLGSPSFSGDHYDQIDVRALTLVPFSRDVNAPIHTNWLQQLRPRLVRRKRSGCSPSARQI